MSIQVSKAAYCPPELNYTGLAPSTISLDAARRSFLYWVNNAQNVQTYQHVGQPLSSYGGSSPDNTYYVICNSMATAGLGTGNEDRRYGVVFDCWGATTASGTLDTTWNSDATTSYTIEHGNAADVTEPPTKRFTESHLGEYNRTSWNNDGFVVHEFNITNVFPANISVFPLPLTNNELNSSSHTGQDYGLQEDIFEIDQPLRGNDAVASPNYSVGDIVQHQHTRDPNKEAMISQSRQCLGQWGHGGGIWCRGAGAIGYQSIFNATMPIKGRNLTGKTAFGVTTNDNVDVAIVARWSTGAKIKLTSAQTSDTVELDLDALALGGPVVGATTPTLVTSKAAMRIDPRGDNITIEAYVDSTTTDIELNTISLWEPHTGSEI